MKSCLVDEVRKMTATSDEIISGSEPSQSIDNNRFDGLIGDADAAELAEYSKWFDRDFYLRQIDLAVARPQDPLVHFLTIGWMNGASPSQQFDVKYYLTKYKDVAALRINPLVHYVRVGQRERRHPSLAQEIASAASVIQRHFDEEYYLLQGPRNLDRYSTAAAHYIHIGCYYGLDPSPEFSTAFYLFSNSDVRNSSINPYVHYIQFGKQEGRSSLPKGDAEIRLIEQAKKIRSEFNYDYYLKRYPEVKKARQDAVVHYLQWGANEGKDPTPSFSTKYYLQTNPDVANAGVNPFWHYLLAGRSEGRSPKSNSVIDGTFVLRLKTLQQQKDAWIKQESSPAAMTGSELEKLLDEHKSDKLAWSITHDDYTTIAGGVQLCVQLEQSAFTGWGATYVAMYPGNHCL